MVNTVVLAALENVVGAGQLLVGTAIEPRYRQDWFVAMEQGSPAALVRPRTTEHVAGVLRVCHEHRVPVVPQGGLTGLVGGATPIEGAVLLSLERLSGIEEIDTAASTLTAWAGTPLQVIQDAAREAGFLYPLDLGARGSCQIGGNVATNAGGNRVIRYGMTRDLVLGLEVVLADGTVVTSLNKMLKNNAGYDLKHLFIGTEGTLGVVTRVVLRLYPQPKSVCAALCAVADYTQALGLLRHVQEGLAGTLSAFEMMWPDFYQSATQKVAGVTQPLRLGYGGYALIEALGADQTADQARFEAVLHAAMEQGIVLDAAIAQSHADTQAFWRIRDAIGELTRLLRPQAKFDVSLPIRAIGQFVEAGVAALRARWPNVRTLSFGHIGDSNVHLNVRVDPPADDVEAEIERIVYGLVRRLHGSISAEHGIGLAKRAYLGYSRSPEEIGLMRALKQALDPCGILNPGKIL